MSGSWDLGTQSVGTGRFLSSGPLDTSYDGLSEPKLGEVHRLLVLPSGSVVVAGDFRLVGSLPVGSLAQLAANNVLSTKPNIAAANTQVWPIPAHATLHVGLDAAAKPQQVTVVDVLGRVVLTVSATISSPELVVSALPVAPYFLRVQYAQGSISQRIIVA